MGGREGWQTRLPGERETERETGRERQRDKEREILPGSKAAS